MTWRRVGSTVLLVIIAAVVPAACGQKDENRPPPTIGDPVSVDRTDGAGVGAAGTTVIVP